MTSTDSSAPARRPLWPWVLALLALVWIVVARIPLVLNAETHLDSDLAVDGLTVAEVVHGHWRWHFPGTPHIGIASVLLAGPQMLVWGMSPITLSSGGVVAYALIVLGTFWLAWTAFGPPVAAWSLVPLAFASTGLVWLAGRLNGGHLLAAAWHVGALALFYNCLARGGFKPSAVLGLWCGLGVWHDSMFLVTFAAVVLVGIGAWWVAGRLRSGLVSGLIFVVAAIVGHLPWQIGRWADPYDVYPDQFASVFEGEVLAQHSRMLALECVPRLIAGHLLFDMETVPSPAAFGLRSASRRDAPEVDLLAWATSLVALGLFAAAWVALARDRSPGDLARAAVRWALWLSAAAVIAGFVVNRNIFNSDNYRYVIYLLVPWAIGFGLLIEGLVRRGAGGAVAASALSALLAVLMTLDTARWYERFGWVDQDLRPVRLPLHDPALDWLEAHPEVTAIYGDYWDVYRLCFLTGARVKGLPFAFYPNRYPQWTQQWPGGRPEILLVRPTRESATVRAEALLSDAQALLTAPNLEIYLWPSKNSRDPSRSQ